MKTKILTEEYGVIDFYENFWTGRKELSVNDVKANKIDKRTFAVADKKFKITGNVFTGEIVEVNGDRYRLTAAIKWYEIIIALIAFVFDIVWGNMKISVTTFPIVAGAIGGAIVGLFVAVNIVCMKRIKKVWLKIIVGIGIGFLSIIICHLLALLILLLAK